MQHEFVVAVHRPQMPEEMNELKGVSNLRLKERGCGEAQPQHVRTLRYLATISTPHRWRTRCDWSCGHSRAPRQADAPHQFWTLLGGWNWFGYPVTVMRLVDPIVFHGRWWLSAFLVFSTCGFSRAADWVRAGLNTNQPIWGLRGGLQFAICPGGFTSDEGGPRGLIRIGHPTLPEGRYDLINFIAIEPVVGTVRGFSELEKSKLDGRQGKLFWTSASPPTNGQPTALSPGEISSPLAGVEELQVPLRVEKFDNGAQVRLVLSQRSDAPDELRLRVHAESDCAPMTACILTATMGNKARARLLWLTDGAVSSLKAFGTYTGPDFTPHAFFPLARLPRNGRGDVVVAITTDETIPAQATGLSRFWQYRGGKVTQYWRKPAAGLNNSLRCAVNARFKYWMSPTPVPGGLAYENFELVEDFKDGQEFVFGVTRHSPAELLKESKPKQQGR